METILADADDALSVSLALRKSSDILALGNMLGKMAPVSPYKSSRSEAVLASSSSRALLFFLAHGDGILL